MGCGSSLVVPIANTTPQQKSGFLQVYEDAFFGGTWELRYFVLHQDSGMLWFKERFDSKPVGGTRLKTVAPFIGLGSMCLKIPNRPDLPNGHHVDHLMALPSDKRVKGKKKRRRDIKCFWVLFANDQDMQSWVEAFKSVLPPPPPPPDQAQQQTSGQPIANGQPVVNGNMVPNGQPPPPGFIVGPQQHPYGQGTQQQQQPYSQNTVVVQNTQHHHHHSSSSGDGFATGLLVGGALGYGLAGPLGWGYGWGWGGYGYGYGLHWGSGSWGSFSSFGSFGSHGCHDGDFGDGGSCGGGGGGGCGGGGCGGGGGGCGGGGCSGGGCGGGCGGCGG